jgi:hypothetical protein
MVILFDEFHLPENVYDVIFATEQQALVAKLLITEMKKNRGVMGKTEMSVFANALHEGVNVEITKPGPISKRERTKISYNKRQFYDRILTPMKAMGMIDYDLYKKQYLISDKFQKDLIKIGLMWNKEVTKQNLSAD